MRVSPPLLSKISAMLWLAFLATAGISAAAYGQSAGEAKRVLILFTHQSDNAAQAIVDQSLRSTLHSSLPIDPEIYSEYLDAVRTPLGEYEVDLVRQMERKYAGKKLDLVLAVNPPALKFLLKYREKVFSGIPIVYLVLDRSNLADIEPAPNVTGVWGEVNYKSNVELALSLHPSSRRVVVVTGVGEWDNYWRSIVQDELLPLEGRVEITYLSGLTIPEQKDAVAALPQQSIVLFVSSTRDREGNNPGNLEVLRQICPVSSAPVYGISDAQLGLGIVGGHILSFNSLGVEGAKVGLRVLAGENAGNIAPHGVPSVPMFDWRQLQRWNVSEKALPAGSVIQFKQRTLWEEYQWYLGGFLLLLTLESFLIGLLIYLRYRRREAEAEALRLHGRLKEIVSNVPGIVWETRTDPVTKQQTTTFVSDYVRKMTGFSAEEWLKEPPDFGLRRTLEEDREKVINDTKAVLESGNEALSEFRSRTRDGRIQWIENYVSPILDSDEKVVGLRGVALDATDRKLAEENARQTEEKDRALLSAIPDLMFLQTQDGIYLDYHAKDPSELLAPPHAFLGKNMRDVLPPDLADRLAEAFARVEDGGKPVILEYSLDVGGHTQCFEARIVRSGKNILSVVRDITDLKRAQLEAQEVSGRLISAQEDERARLARDLHDGACQNLALLAIELELLARDSQTNGNSLQGDIKALSERVADLSNDLRQMSHQLHPARLSRLGLGSAVRGLCNEIEATHSVKIEFVERDVPATLPPLVSLNLYRIVQESLQNVVKHSSSSRASVSISTNGENLVLSISDDGCGFDPGGSSPKGSLGLISIRERIRLLNGAISINSRPRGGTCIDASIPLNRNTNGA